MHTTKSLQTRVVIIDDHQIVSAALAELLETDGRIQVVAQAQSFVEGKAILEREGFDVLLLDLELRDGHGLNLLPLLKSPAAACIVSMHMTEHYVREAIVGGALGYVSKDACPEELLSAIHAVARGETFFSSDVRQAALAFSLNTRPGALTSREGEVLPLAAQGHTSSEVAAKLGISRRTAEAHRASFFKKLSLRTQTDLIRYALRNGLIAAEGLRPLQNREEGGKKTLGERASAESQRSTIDRSVCGARS